jgi:hypothetical protein
MTNIPQLFASNPATLPLNPNDLTVVNQDGVTKATPVSAFGAGESSLTLIGGTSGTVAAVTSLTIEDAVVTGSDGAATVAVSGGGSVPPSPFFGTALQTGWTRPPLATFNTWLNQGVATATDGAGGLPLLIRDIATDDNQTSNLIGLLKPIGAPPWTITCGMAASTNCGSSLSTAFAPVILNNSEAGSAVVLWWTVGAPQGDSGLIVLHYNSTAPGAGFTTVSDTRLGFTFNTYFEWFRVINDGTTLTFQISDEGQEFETIYAEAANALVTSFDTVGFGMDSYSLAGASFPVPIVMAAKLWWWED